jgi:hypothetical protein
VRWAQSVREALSGNPVLLAVIDPLLAAGTALRNQLDTRKNLAWRPGW